MDTETQFIEELKANGNKEIVFDSEVLGWATSLTSAEECFRDLTQSKAKIELKETDTSYIITEISIQ